MRKMPLLTDCFLKRIPLFLPLSNKNFKKTTQKPKIVRIVSKQAVKPYKTPKMQQDEKRTLYRN